MGAKNSKCNDLAGEIVTRAHDKSVYFLVELAFENKRKQHINICSQSQTNKCRNNQWLFLDLVCRQISVIFTDKTFAVNVAKGKIKSGTFKNYVKT